ncbi:hypothetical protein ACIQ7Q_31085 [Streptomyces sp. NPDC096176]|uniref:hypothetical protein n=1 Tax=Streptomyces sp. NPDC096176 TaxID=3366079 RepID=UPI00380D5759
MEIQHALEGSMAANSLPPGTRMGEQFRAAATESALKAIRNLPNKQVEHRTVNEFSTFVCPAHRARM